MSQKNVILLALCFIMIAFASYLGAQERSLSLNGTDQYVSCGSNTDFNLTTNFTLEAWIYPTNWKTGYWENSIIGKTERSTTPGIQETGFVFRYGSANRTLDFTFGNGSSWSDTAVSSVLTLNAWNHVAATYSWNGSQSTVKLYVNGSQVGSTKTYNTRVVNRETTLKIGADWMDGSEIRAMQGLIEEVRIWNVVRTESQIYENRFADVFSQSDLVAYYKMNEDLTDKLNYANGTGINNPTYSTNIPLAAPSITAATSITATGFTANWNVTTGATSYRLDVSTDNSFSSYVSGYQDLNVGNSIFHAITGLNANATYFYCVRAVNDGGTSENSSSSTITTRPLTASYNAPANAASGTDNPPDLSWTAPNGGCTGYHLYLGTDTPPTNIMNGEIHAGTSYTPALLQYNTAYYWMAVPYNSTGDAQGATINSFTTTDTYSEPAPGLIVGETSITPAIEISGITGVFAPTVSTSWNPEGTPYQNVGLQIVIAGVNMSGRLVVINPDQDFIPTGLAYRILPSTEWNYVSAEDDWRTDYAYFTVNNAKADGDIEIIFPESGDITLPVELSAFNAVYSTQSNYVMISWLTQSETNHLGYNVLRSESGSLQNASRLNSSLITAGENIGTEVSYQFQDQDVYPNSTYHYWLESVSINGNPQYHGPIVLSVPLPEDELPNPPLTTRLIGAYPNPFNPSATISFVLDKPEQACITIYNARGQIVKSFSQNYAQPGSYSIIWNGKDDSQNTLSSGIYYYSLTAGKYTETKKMILSK